MTHTSPQCNYLTSPALSWSLLPEKAERPSFEPPGEIFEWGRGVIQVDPRPRKDPPLYFIRGLNFVRGMMETEKVEHELEIFIRELRPVHLSPSCRCKWRRGVDSKIF